ncbi:hypothetical protein V7S43_006132 [Phytophthora oleae]|uniref:Uncharacterized protein n=1 Tax=Phytophthora oleae TaxID=2107226 RepID=A0ABD3FSY4_9STRA
MHRSPRYLYLLTNLHFWIAEFEDEEDIFLEHMSADFKADAKRYLEMNPKKKRGGEKWKSDGCAAPQTSKFVPFPPLVKVEQLLPGRTTLTEVHRFLLDSGVCWRSSAHRDFAIFKVIAPPPSVQLVRLRFSIGGLFPTSVRVYGFPSAREEKFGHSDANIPVQSTHWNGNKLLIRWLSDVGFSGSAVVCSKTGIAVGYIVREVDESSVNEQYRWYVTTFDGLPTGLWTRFPSDADDEKPRRCDACN